MCAGRKTGAAGPPAAGRRSGASRRRLDGEPARGHALALGLPFHITDCGMSEDIVASGEEVNAGHLKAFIERIERLEEEKKAIADEIKDAYAKAKGNGSD